MWAGTRTRRPILWRGQRSPRFRLVSRVSSSCGTGRTRSSVRASPSSTPSSRQARWIAQRSRQRTSPPLRTSSALTQRGTQSFPSATATRSSWAAPFSSTGATACRRTPARTSRRASCSLSATFAPTASAASEKPRVRSDAKGDSTPVGTPHASRSAAWRGGAA
eukprot:Amastigsp_a180682_32.p3 type:complete len:164 gc:universal Amastigsp_a180682_32:941-450(-)